MVGSAIMGVNYTIVAPKELWPEEELVAECKELAVKSGAKIKLTADVKSGVKGADAIYTDVWVSMGEEAEFEKRIQLLKPYQVNMKMIEMTENPDLIFLHCLPAYHNTETENGQKIFKEYGLEEMEVTEEVFESKYSKVFDEAENRMHTIKAVMTATL
jgi:ornithine carbamoyltransferase